MTAAFPRYRPDIDGLRAFAVVPVILYHAGVPFFSGGYVGVDVFFVISGYLIASLIIAEVDAGSFSLLRFYERRIRRIFPALFFVMACCAAFGWFVLAPDAYKRLGNSIVAASLFLSNILFWRQSGYFDTSAAEKPLLHTWSLAVEEQFYIFFPLYILLLAKLFPKQRLKFTAVLCVSSFLVSAIAVYYKPWATFYLAPTRAWELLIGALLAMEAAPITLSARWHNAAFTVGTTLIAIAVFCYTKETTFPGSAALLPAGGTALVLWAGTRPTSLINLILATGPAVFVGKISYSLYLWHYPLFAFASYLSIDNLSQASAIYLMIALPALAVLSWRLVEQPFRKPTDTTRRSKRTIAVALATIVVFSGLGLAPSHDISGPQMSASEAYEPATARDEYLDTDQCFRRFYEDPAAGSPCKIGKPDQIAPTFLLWGDSHAEVLIPALQRVADRRATSGYAAGWPDCPPLSNIVNLKEKNCDEGNEAVFRFLEKNRSVKSVILAARWSWASEGRRYQSEDLQDRLQLTFIGPHQTDSFDNHRVFAFGLERTILRLTELGKAVWVVGPIPEISHNVPKALYLQSLGLYPGTRIEPTVDEFHQRQQFALSTFHDLATRYPLHFVWIHGDFCHEDVCEVQRNGTPLYQDNNHLSVYGARSVSHLFDVIFDPGQS